MTFLIVAVFCAHFVVAFSQEFNSTIPSQLTGRMETTSCQTLFQAPRMNLVRMNNDEDEVICEATLVTANSVAMTEWCSNEGDLRFALVLCKSEDEEEKYLKCPMDANLQKIRGIGIVEVEFTEAVSQECWPGGRQVFPLISISASKGDLVTLLTTDEDGSSLTFTALIGDIDDNYVTIEPYLDHPLECQWIDGSTLYHNFNLLGIFSLRVMNMFHNIRKFVRVHEMA